MEDKKKLIQDLLAAGVHFGHQTKRWNPKMKKFIYSEKNGIHIIDVTQTVELLDKALEFLQSAASKGDIVFVGTKKQAQNIIKDAAMRSGSYYIINRWPGGMLTNHAVIRLSLNKMDEILKNFQEGIQNRTKKELILMKRELTRLDRLYGGLRGFNRKPAAIFVVDPKVEFIAVREARKMGVPIVAMVDTNTDPDLADYIIPANDDALKSITLITELVAKAVETGNGGKGIKHELIDFGQIDMDIAQMSTKLAEQTPQIEKKSSEEVMRPQVFRVNQKAVSQPEPEIEKKVEPKSVKVEKELKEVKVVKKPVSKPATKTITKSKTTK